MRKVLIAAGGSGGHLFPAQQLAAMLKRRGDWEILFVGHGLGMSPFFEKESVAFVDVPAEQLRSWKFFPALVGGVGKSLWRIRAFDPDVVVGFGSYHAFPALVAAALLRKKIVLFEANAVLGKVNRLFRPVAQCVAVQFPLRGDKIEVVPLLPWVFSQRLEDRIEARRHFGLERDALTFLVFGGSQGAKFLNEQIPEALSRYNREVQVLHFTGKDENNVAASYERLGVRAYVRPFEPNMALAYAAADCALCRAGASTVAELIRYQVPALLIPFPLATEDHQRKNGEYLVHAHAARLLIQKEATLDRLVLEIGALLNEREEIKLSLQKISLQTSHRRELVELVGGVAS